jgi:hypothetical protein
LSGIASAYRFRVFCVHLRLLECVVSEKELELIVHFE